MATSKSTARKPPFRPRSRAIKNKPKKLMNYDPNLNSCGRMTKQVVRLVLGKWEFRKEFLVEVYGNQTGLEVINNAAELIYEAFQDDDDYAKSAQSCIVGFEKDKLDWVAFRMTKPYHELLEDAAQWLQGEEEIKNMIISAEIVSVEPHQDA